MLNRPCGAETSGPCSTNEVTSQKSYGQIQRRLRHRIRAGRPTQGASIISTMTGRDDAATGQPLTGSQDSTSSTRPDKSLRHRDQVEAGKVEQKIASVATMERVRAWSTMVGHRRRHWYEQRLRVRSL